MLLWLIENAVAAALLAGGVALLCRARRFRPAVCHALWLLVLLKLLTPPLLRWPWPLAPPAPFVVVDVEPPTPVEDETPVFAARDEAGEPVEAAVPVEAAPLVEPAEVVSSPRRETVGAAVVRLWLAGAGVMALLQGARLVRFRRRVACGAAAPAWLTEEVAELAALLGMRPPPVRVLGGLASPVVWGFGRARLVWPAELLEGLPDASRRAATVHELAHLRRRDHWVGWLQLVASCLWWWNPVFWLARRRLGRSAELACDAWVVATLPASRRAYAEALLRVCERLSRKADPVPALGMGGAREELERRLVMIMRESVPARLPLRALGGVVLLALLVLPVWSQDVNERPNPGTQETLPAPIANPPAAEPARVYQYQSAAAAPDREQRLQRLEAMLQELAKEMRDLRGEKSKPAVPVAKTPAQAAPTKTPYSIAIKQAPPNVVTEFQYYPQGWNVTDANKPNQPITLHRVTYNLPKEKAQALAALLDVQPKLSVLEVVAREDAFTVTTTPEAQHVIAEFVDLLQGKVKKPHLNVGYRTWAAPEKPQAK